MEFSADWSNRSSLSYGPSNCRLRFLIAVVVQTVTDYRVLKKAIQLWELAHASVGRNLHPAIVHGETLQWNWMR